MKKRILALGCMAALLAFGSEAQAETATASATIGGSVTVTKITDTTTPNGVANASLGNLAFGHVIPAATIGTVIVAPNNGRTFTGAVSGTNSLSVGSAKFAVQGNAGATYIVTVSDSVNITSGSNSMVVDTFTKNNLALDASGAGEFGVGGTLHVGINQAAGAYTGTFEVTAAYN